MQVSGMKSNHSVPTALSSNFHRNFVLVLSRFRRKGGRAGRSESALIQSCSCLYRFQSEVPDQKAPAQASARIQSFLSTDAPFHLVVLDNSSSRDVSMALRIAHDLNAYHRLDAEIILGNEAFQDRLADGSATGNILIIGNTASPSLASLLGKQRTPFRSENNVLTFKDATFDEAGQGGFLSAFLPSRCLKPMEFRHTVPSSASSQRNRPDPISSVDRRVRPGKSWQIVSHPDRRNCA